MRIPCEFCGKPIAKGGAMDAHVHFKHLPEYLERFRRNPAIVTFLAAMEIYDQAVRVSRGLLLPERCA